MTTSPCLPFSEKAVLEGGGKTADTESMKTSPFAILMLFLFVPTLWAVELVVSNVEQETLVFGILPPGQETEAALAESPAKARALVLAQAGNLSYIPAATYTVIRQNGPGILLGYYTSPGRDTCPVVMVRFAPGGTNAFAVGLVHSLRVRGAAVTIPIWELPPESEPVRVDNRYLDWDKIPFLARFAPHYGPASYLREDAAGKQLRPVDEARYWKKGGTQLESLKMYRSGKVLYLMAGTYSEIAADLSLILYTFPKLQEPDSPLRTTIEIPVREASGPVFLWIKGSSKPVHAGFYARTGFYLEARIDLGVLADHVARFPDHASVDLATVFFAGAESEEFYFSRFTLGDIPASLPGSR